MSICLAKRDRVLVCGRSPPRDMGPPKDDGDEDNGGGDGDVDVDDVVVVVVMEVAERGGAKYPWRALASDLRQTWRTRWTT